MVFRNDISLADYQALRASVGWVELPEAQAMGSIQGACDRVACYDGEVCIAFARIFWDGGYIAYLSDVIVRPERQGEGLGREVTERAIAAFQKRIPALWLVKIVLVASKGKEDFYRKFDFIDRPNDLDGAGMYRWVESI